MLFTRCPECETTFRITEDALQKAGGQVRCGRCAHIFNAYRELREHLADERRSTDEADALTGTDESAALTGAASPAGDERPRAMFGNGAAAEDIVLESDEQMPDGATVRPESADEDEDEDPTTDRAEALSADEVDATLEQVADIEPAEPAWMRAREEKREPARLWGAAAGAAFALLALQAVHHYRAELAGQPVIGTALRQSYGFAGIDIAPRWDANHYDLVDWVAVAEPAASGQGNLIIRSRVQNTGPDDQPYPFVHLRLLDRWEKTVGSRIFGPEDYMPGEAERERMMPAGATAEAELVIVDPGPDAYGFELDVCVETGGGFSCATDRTYQ